MRYIFLSEAFYNKYPMSEYPEIEHKESRPYILLVLNINGEEWGIPMRSGISHHYCFWTNKAEKRGVDYSKAVLISDKKFIDETRKPHIRKDEFEALRGKEHILEVGFKKYILTYKKAHADQSKSRSFTLCSYSTLQYFHEAIGLRP
jgi:protein AbiQ